MTNSGSGLVMIKASTGRLFWRIIPPTPVLGAMGALTAAAFFAASMETIAIPLLGMQVIILPMTIAFLLALLLNIGLFRWQGVQHHNRISGQVSAALTVLILPFLVRLGAMVGQMLPVVIEAGPALLLQEIGHFFGTVLLSMPIAIYLLKLGRETVGASFSIARETSVAIIAERYGLKSPEGHGVMAVYVAGTLFGTLVFSFIAAFFSAFDVFDYRALAVACGVGSGSMTAACGGTLAALFPDRAEQVLALSAASNLLSSVTGFYITLFVTLPLVERLYRWARPDDTVKGQYEFDARDESETPQAQNVADVIRWVVVGAVVLVISSLISTRSLSVHDIYGLVLVVSLGIVSYVLGSLLKERVPAVFWASLVGILTTLPGSPLAPLFAQAISGVDLLALAITPLTLAGLALGSAEWRTVKHVGWKLLLVCLLIFLGTFLGSVTIAQFTLELGHSLG